MCQATSFKSSPITFRVSRWLIASDLFGAWIFALIKPKKHVCINQKLQTNDFEIIDLSRLQRHIQTLLTESTSNLSIFMMKFKKRSQQLMKDNNFDEWKFGQTNSYVYACFVSSIGWRQSYGERFTQLSLSSIAIFKSNTFLIDNLASHCVRCAQPSKNHLVEPFYWLLNTTSKSKTKKKQKSMIQSSSTLENLIIFNLKFGKTKRPNHASGLLNPS